MNVIMSKKIYRNETTARRAGLKSGKEFVGTHMIEPLKFVYLFKPTLVA